MRSYEFNRDSYKWVPKKSKFQKFMMRLRPYWWDEFWYKYHWNGIIGPGSHRSDEFREGRLALVFAIAAFIIITIGVGILILK